MLGLRKMGAQQGKVRIASDSPQPSCLAGGSTPPLKAPIYEQASSNTRHHRLSLKKLLRLRNDFQQESTPLKAGGVEDFDENKPLPEKPKKGKKTRRGLFKSKLEREVYENLYNELPLQAVMLEDIAPSTSIGNGQHGGQRRRREPRMVKETFDHRVLIKYDIQALIGKGSFSRVVRAEQRGTGRSYAMKLVTATDGRGPFENELAILSRLDHPNLIRLHEVIRTPSRVYLVLDLATGGELYEHIVARGRFGERETAETVAQILEGVSYLHRRSITHRDLKPENLLYTTHPASRDSRILITDFGLAFQLTAPDQRMTETCGTPEYIAPEVLMRFPYDSKIDLWSTGVITYILLSGIMPFDSESRTRLYRQIIRGRYTFYPEFWSTVTLEAMGFVSALLETEPGERLSAEEALNHPWLRPVRKRLLGRSPSAVSTTRRASSRTARSPSLKGHHQRPLMGTMGSGLSDALGNHGSPDRSRPLTQSPAPVERTRSSRSIRSVARSDHTHRVQPAEVDRLWQDPELRRIVFDKARSKVGGAKSDTEQGGTVISVPGSSRRGESEVRKALAPSSSDNFCIVGVTSSLPRQNKTERQSRNQGQNGRANGVKDYGLV